MTGISLPKPASKGNTSAFWRFISTGGGGLLIVVLLFVAIMSVVSKQFLSTFNIFVLTREVSTAVLIGFSQMIVLAIGQMNLSVGAIGGLVVVVTGGLMEVYQWPIWAAVVAGLSVGVLAGMLNGFIITRTGLNAFIVTIATASIFLGLNLGMTQAQPFYKIPAAYKAIGQARWLFVPRMSVVTIVVIILMAIFLYRMLAGRHLLAVGGNANAAETSGIPVKRMVVLSHCDFRVPGRCRGHAVERAARLGPTDDRPELDAAVFRHPDHRRRGAGRWVGFAAGHRPCRLPDRDYQQCPGASPG